MTQPMTYQVHTLYIVQDVNGRVIGKARGLDDRAFGNYLFTPAEDFLTARNGSLRDHLGWLADLPDVSRCRMKQPGDRITWTLPGGFVIMKGTVRSVTDFGYTAYHDDSPPGIFPDNPEFHYSVHTHQVVA